MALEYQKRQIRLALGFFVALCLIRSENVVAQGSGQLDPVSRYNF